MPPAGSVPQQPGSTAPVANSPGQQQQAGIQGQPQQFLDKHLGIAQHFQDAQKRGEDHRQSLSFLRGSGFSDDDIRQGLRSSGMPDFIVDSTLAAQGSPQQREIGQTPFGGAPVFEPSQGGAQIHDLKTQLRPFMSGKDFTQFEKSLAELGGGQAGLNMANTQLRSYQLQQQGDFLAGLPPEIALQFRAQNPNIGITQGQPAGKPAPVQQGEQQIQQSSSDLISRIQSGQAGFDEIGDVNNDGKMDFNDFLIFAANQNKQAQQQPLQKPAQPANDPTAGMPPEVAAIFKAQNPNIGTDQSIASQATNQASLPDLLNNTQNQIAQEAIENRATQTTNVVRQDAPVLGKPTTVTSGDELSNSPQSFEGSNLDRLIRFAQGDTSQNQGDIQIHGQQVNEGETAQQAALRVPPPQVAGSSPSERLASGRVRDRVGLTQGDSQTGVTDLAALGGLPSKQGPTFNPAAAGIQTQAAPTALNAIPTEAPDALDKKDFTALGSQPKTKALGSVAQAPDRVTADLTEPTTSLPTFDQETLNARQFTAKPSTAGAFGGLAQPDIFADAETVARNALQGNPFQSTSALELADLEQGQDARRAQRVEELNRLGILRGGDTAGVLGELDAGADRERLALLAQQEARRSRGFDQALALGGQQAGVSRDRAGFQQAAQELIGRESGRTDSANLAARGQDINALIAGRGQNVTARGQDLSATVAARGQDVSQRGQDINRELTGRGQEVTARGQDIAAGVAGRGQNVSARGQDINALISGRGQDVTARGQDLSREVAGRGQDITARGQDINSLIAGRGQDITARGQDISQDVAERGQDLNRLIAGRGQDVTARGQDVIARGQDISRGVAERGQDVTQRGQDVSRDVAERGQDTTARGQDITQRIADRQGNIQQRGQDLDQTLGLDRNAASREDSAARIEEAKTARNQANLGNIAQFLTSDWGGLEGTVAGGLLRGGNPLSKFGTGSRENRNTVNKYIESKRADGWSEEIIRESLSQNHSPEELAEIAKNDPEAAKAIAANQSMKGLSGNFDFSNEAIGKAGASLGLGELGHDVLGGRLGRASRGAGIGASIGSVVPVIGTGIGAAIGGGIGAMTGESFDQLSNAELQKKRQQLVSGGNAGAKGAAINPQAILAIDSILHSRGA